MPSPPSIHPPSFAVPKRRFQSFYPLVPEHILFLFLLCVSANIKKWILITFWIHSFRLSFLSFPFASLLSSLFFSSLSYTHLFSLSPLSTLLTTLISHSIPLTYAHTYLTLHTHTLSLPLPYLLFSSNPNYPPDNHSQITTTNTHTYTHN